MDGLRDDGGFAIGLRHARFRKRPFTASYEVLAAREAVIQAVAADRYGIAVLGWGNASATSDQVRVLPLVQAYLQLALSPQVKASVSGTWRL